MAMKAKTEDEQPKYSRSEAARIIPFSPTRLVQLEREGIVKPTRIANGFVLYSEADITLLKKRRKEHAKRRLQASFAND